MMDSPTQRTVAQWYDEQLDEVDERSSGRDYGRATETFLSQVNPDLGVVVDVGCGAGRQLEVLKDAGLDVIGVDPSARMRTAAMALGFDVFAGMFEQLDALSLPKLAGVWATGTLPHLETPALAPAFSAVKRTLGPGSVLLVNGRAGVGGKQDASPVSGVVRQVWFHDPAEVAAALEGAGFSPRERWEQVSIGGADWYFILAVVE